MGVAMLVPWAAVLALFALGASTAFRWLAQSGSASMALGIMLLRRDHYTGGALHSESRPRRHIRWRRILLVVAYVSAIIIAPGVLGAANIATVPPPRVGTPRQHSL